jgi:hypothetical protein
MSKVGAGTIAGLADQVKPTGEPRGSPRRWGVFPVRERRRQQLSCLPGRYAGVVDALRVECNDLEQFTVALVGSLIVLAGINQQLQRSAGSAFLRSLRQDSCILRTQE